MSAHGLCHYILEGEVRFGENKYFAFCLARKATQEVREQWKYLGRQEPFQIFTKDDKNEMGDMLLRSLQSMAPLEIERKMESLNDEKKWIPMIPAFFYSDGYAFLDFLFKMLEMDPDAVEIYYQQGQKAFEHILPKECKKNVPCNALWDSTWRKRKPHVFEMQEALLSALNFEMEKGMKNPIAKRIRSR